MEVAIKGKGGEFKWVDLQDLPVTKEFVKFKKETEELIAGLKTELVETKRELEKAKLGNIEIVKGLISR